jgi:hypothetical protein
MNGGPHAKPDGVASGPSSRPPNFVAVISLVYLFVSPPPPTQGCRRRVRRPAYRRRDRVLVASCSQSFPGPLGGPLAFVATHRPQSTASPSVSFHKPAQ